KWGENAANAIWDAAIVKIILGGVSNSRDLQDLSTLIGERDEYTDSTTIGDHGTRSNQRSIRRVPILPPDRLRTLPFGTGITMLRSASPIVTNLRSWVSREDAKTLRADRTQIETLLQQRPEPAKGWGASCTCLTRGDLQTVKAAAELTGGDGWLFTRSSPFQALSHRSRS